MVDFGKKLKKLRTNAKLTQQELADRIGVSNTTISFCENTERYPSTDILIRIANYFHISTDYLLGIDNTKVLNISELNEEEVKSLQNLIQIFLNNRKNKF